MIVLAAKNDVIIRGNETGNGARGYAFGSKHNLIDKCAII